MINCWQLLPYEIKERRRLFLYKHYSISWSASDLWFVESKDFFSHTSTGIIWYDYTNGPNVINKPKRRPALKDNVCLQWVGGAGVHNCQCHINYWSYCWFNMIFLMLLKLVLLDPHLLNLKLLSQYVINYVFQFADYFLCYLSLSDDQYAIADTLVKLLIIHFFYALKSSWSNC